MEQAQFQTPTLHSLWAVMERARQQSVRPILPEWIPPTLDPIRDRLAQPATRRFNKAVGLTVILHGIVTFLLMSLFLPADVKQPDIIVTSVTQEQPEPLTLLDDIPLPTVEDPGSVQSAVALLQTAVEIQESKTATRELAIGGRLGGFGGGPGTMFGGSRRAKSIVFLIDRSGSMSGYRLEMVKEQLLIAIAKLNETQSYEVIFYSNSAYRLLGSRRRGLFAATPDNLTTVKRKLEQIRATGGNNEAFGFKVALAMKPELILFLTDGQFSIDVNRVILEPNKAQTRINTVLIDSTAAHPVMQEIATKTGGYFRTVKLRP